MYVCIWVCMKNYPLPVLGIRRKYNYMSADFSETNATLSLNIFPVNTNGFQDSQLLNMLRVDSSSAKPKYSGCYGYRCNAVTMGTKAEAPGGGGSRCCTNGLRHAQELQMEKIQLELENQKMEQTLREFQSTWNKGKEEIKSGGYHWKSGSVGKFGNKSHITSQRKANATKAKDGKQHYHEFLRVEIWSSSCGNHDYGSAVCLECGEDYCSGCFAKMHQKGALKFHRTTLLQAKSQILSNVLDVAHRFIKEPIPPSEGNSSVETSTKSQQKPKARLLQEKSSEVETTEAEGGKGTNPLYEMPFDEEASAQSFREALTQWRAGQQKENKQQDSHAKKPGFSSGGCYKLENGAVSVGWKRTPQEQLRNILPNTSHEATMEKQCSQNESNDDSDGQKTRRPSTVNLPVSNSARKGSSCCLSSCPRSRSAAAHSLSRAASEISEIEYIDVTDQNEPLLDYTEDQQTLDSLEKELKVLRNLSEPSEKLQSQPSDELQTFTHYSRKASQMPEDLQMSSDSDPCDIEITSSGRNTEMQSLLSLGDYSTDEEEEEFLDKQHVSALPWAKNV
ncbi:zinc finger B-box domain containing [Cricetulus griseus]